MKTLKERYVIDNKGNKTDVIISVSDYDKLLEDLHDLAVLTERREMILQIIIGLRVKIIV